MKPMHKLLTRLWDLFFAPIQSAPLDPEEARNDFQHRYRNFRSLLTANNNALQAMAELEKMYYGGDSYRMADIRSKVTTILVNVYKMINCLVAMAPGRYDVLAEVFEKISGELEKTVERRPIFCDGPLLLELQAVTRAEREHVGDKMANLGEAASLPGIRVPAGFVITASATRRLLSPQLITEINRQLQILDPENLTEFYRICANLQQLVLEAPVPPEVLELIYAYYGRLEGATHPGCKVALRSSALGEDAAGVSFAGLYKTILEVDRDSLADAYRQVVASKYGARAIAYRRRRGYRHEDVEMCVGCLAMVSALVSGVVYSRDPSGADNDIIRINATAGYGKGVVDGTRLVDLYLVGKDKPHPVLFSELRSGGLDGGGQAGTSGVLNYHQIRQLAEAANTLERHFGRPQDIEWSFDHHGALYILQSRPIMESREEEKAEPRQVPAIGTDAVEPLLVGGVTASGGVAWGRVVVVDDREITALPREAVLVLEYPLPEYAPLVGRAAAIIAEYGSEAGHLATVAREFSIPALFGVTDARRILGGQEEVTVNSLSRAIYGGRREDILKDRPVRRDPMAGSPIQRLMTEALQYITPLNLSDPASTQFKPSWCETLHDITRFCHEKSVTEMFNINRLGGFDKRAAKRLVGGVPLDWSVINLADGFSSEYDESEPVVHIDKITSLPMRAICRGIAAVPWEGPPPMSGRGFGSIIFQSAMRPDLDPAVASPLASKNYFMISRHFCNVSVRLGYHYAMIEAYLSELLTESYVTFRFKGGAADLRRKAVRAKLLADVLERYDFRVELRSDALLARLKKRPIPFLEARLQVLGYLILHARQLDMVMNQPQTVERYREKFIAEIETMLNQSGTVEGDHDNTDTAAAGG